MNRKDAFSLLELLIVVGIFALMAFLLIPIFQAHISYRNAMALAGVGHAIHQASLFPQNEFKTPYAPPFAHK